MPRVMESSETEIEQHTADDLSTESHEAGSASQKSDTLPHEATPASKGLQAIQDVVSRFVAL